MYLLIKRSKYQKFFWGCMALYLLNICVDVPDMYPDTVPEDLTYNDQESIVEIFIEKVLGYENAIPEYDEADPENNSTLKTQKIIDHFVVHKEDTRLKGLLRIVQKKAGFRYLSFAPSVYPEIDPPPPEV